MMKKQTFLDDEFDAVIEQVVEAMGREAQRIMEDRHARGLPDPDYDLSIERQTEVISRLEQEMERLRPLKDRLLGKYNKLDSGGSETSDLPIAEKDSSL